MDECLPLDSLDASTLRMLLTQERTRREELEEEVARLRAGLARQNQVILRLEQRDAEREQELAVHRTLLAGLTEQNTLLRQQVARLEQENAHLRGMPLAPAPAPVPEGKPATPEREQKTRKQRAPEHNHGRLKLERANQWVDHAAETCPQCGEHLRDGWIQRRIHVIDLPTVAPLEITEHRILRRPDRREWIPAVGSACCLHPSAGREDASDAAGLDPGSWRRSRPWPPSNACPGDSSRIGCNGSMGSPSVMAASSGCSSERQQLDSQPTSNSSRMFGQVQSSTPMRPGGGRTGSIPRSGR